MKRALALAVMGAVMAACGGGSSGGSSPGGSTGGTGPTGGSSTQIGFVLPATTCSGISLAGVAVFVATNQSISNACTQVSNACVKYANLDGVALIVANYTSTGTAAAVTPGTYSISTTPSTSGTMAFATLVETDASCNSDAPSGTASGTITLTSVTSTTVTGSYDITLGSQNLTGTIDATLCTTTFPGDVCSGSSSGTCTGTTQCL